MIKKYPCALPEHLRDKKHNDWPWPLSNLSRSINVRGPRCGKGSPGYMSWPPKLIKGKGIARWESTGAESIIEIPDLANREIRAADVYGKEWEAIERNPGHILWQQKRTILLEWKENTSPDQYSPSTIQKFSKEGYIELSPSFKCWWKKGTFFARWGWRPDHLDVYYNWGPYIGGNFE